MLYVFAEMFLELRLILKKIRKVKTICITIYLNNCYQNGQLLGSGICKDLPSGNNATTRKGQNVSGSNQISIRVRDHYQDRQKRKVSGVCC
jgi:hypothetical protein